MRRDKNSSCIASGCGLHDQSDNFHQDSKKGQLRWISVTLLSHTQHSVQMLAKLSHYFHQNCVCKFPTAQKTPKPSITVSVTMLGLLSLMPNNTAKVFGFPFLHKPSLCSLLLNQPFSKILLPYCKSKLLWDIQQRYSLSV